MRCDGLDNTLYESLTAELDARLCPECSFDILRRTVNTEGGFRCTLYLIDGLTDDALAQKLMEYFVSSTDPKKCCTDVPYAEVDLTADPSKLAVAVLSGASALVVEGAEVAAIVDTRSYPARSIGEPESDRVLRGSRDGFTETLVFNTALLRRRVRDQYLRVRMFEVGAATRTNIALCYIEGRADADKVNRIAVRLSQISADALSMGQESLAECLVGGWLNPYPKIRYTERPDAAAANILEGRILIFCDNSPSAMLLPTSIFDFLQESDDFYFPPVVGTYLRVIRALTYLLALLVTPTWYLLVNSPELFPRISEFLSISEPAAIPLFWQLIIAELTIDGLKLASLNTPNMLGSSLSVVGGLILGDFAIEAGWFASEAILYMAFTAIANSTQPSYELGYAIKFFRMLILTLTALFGIWGYAGGLLINGLYIALNRTPDSLGGYLYPLIPFSARAMLRVLVKGTLRGSGAQSIKPPKSSRPSRS